MESRRTAKTFPSLSTREGFLLNDALKKSPVFFWFSRPLRSRRPQNQCAVQEREPLGKRERETGFHAVEVIKAVFVPKKAGGGAAAHTITDNVIKPMIESNELDHMQLSGKDILSSSSPSVV